jgi:hypothetical protein
MKKLLLLAFAILGTALNILADRNFSFRNHGFQPPQEVIAGIKVGDQFTITDVPYRISPPAPLTLKDDTGKPYAKNTKATYGGTSKQPGQGTLVYTITYTPIVLKTKNVQSIIPKIAPQLTVLSQMQQPSLATLSTGRGPSGPGTRTPLRAQAAQDVRIATISEQPAKGTIATTTPAAQPLQANIEDIIVPGTPQKIATIEQIPYPQQLSPAYTPTITKPQFIGTAVVEEPVILDKPQYGTITYDTSALESAAERAKRAAQNLREQTAFAALSQEAKQKMLIEAVQKTDLETVKRILNSGFKDNGLALEEAELFALDVEDANSQEIIRLLRESAGISDLEALEQELQSE